jgi:hypothetical protein
MDLKMATVLTERCGANAVYNLIMCQYEEETHIPLNIRQPTTKIILERGNIL